MLSIGVSALGVLGFVRMCRSILVFPHIRSFNPKVPCLASISMTAITFVSCLQGRFLSLLSRVVCEVHLDPVELRSVCCAWFGLGIDCAYGRYLETLCLQNLAGIFQNLVGTLKKHTLAETELASGSG